MKNTLFTLIVAFMTALFMSSCSTYESVSYGHSPRVTVTIGQPYSYYLNHYDYYGYGWHNIYYWHWHLMPYYVYPSYHFNWYYPRQYRWRGYMYNWNKPHHYGNHWHGNYNQHNGVLPNPNGNSETYKARVRNNPSGTSGSMSRTRGSNYNSPNNSGVSKSRQGTYQRPSNSRSNGNRGYNRTTNSSRPSGTYRNGGNRGLNGTSSGRPSSGRSGKGRR